MLIKNQLDGSQSTSQPTHRFIGYYRKYQYIAKPTLYITEALHEKMCLRCLLGRRRPRSDCANAQSDLGLRCPIYDLGNVKYKDL